jgi:hypothetical protein
VGLLVIVGVLAAIAVWQWARTPPDEVAVMPACPSWSLLGVHCSGCGMTRAVRAGLAGDIPQMVAYNIFSPIALPLLVVILGRHAWWWAWETGSKTSSGRTQSPLWVFAGVVFAFGVVRNLPWPPFPLLAPHELSRMDPPAR